MAESRLLYRSIEEWRELAWSDEISWEKDIQSLMLHIQQDAHFSNAIVSLDDTHAVIISQDVNLAGVPYFLKDLFDVKGQATTASSIFLNNIRGIPSNDSAIVNWSRDSGAMLMGKTHLNEFAYGLDGVNPHFGTVPNPWDTSLLAGGSSSGSAYAVAKGWTPFAIGTDTGGSIRVPAAFCGLYGFRLTPEHLLSNDGCFPLAPSYDTAGWFTRTPEDMISLIEGLYEYRGNSTFNGLSLINAYPEIDAEIFVAATHFSSKFTGHADNEFIERWKSANQNAVTAFNVLQSGEAYQVHKAWLHDYKSEYDPATWGRIMRAENWSIEDKEGAASKRNELVAFFESYFSKYDFLVIPAAPAPAPKIADGMPDAFRSRLLALTAPASITGIPVLSLPLRLETGLTSGLQILLPKDIHRAASIAITLLTQISKE